MAGIGVDLRHAVRRLRRSPSFALTAVLTLALGIGANTAIYSFVHGVLLSPLPYPDPEQLVIVLETRDRTDRTASLLNFAGWREAATGLQGVAAVRRWPFNVTGGGRPYRVTGVQASAGLLAVLGARPLAGREFTRHDERPGAEPVCLVSHAFWVERLGSRADLTGQTLALNGRAHSVVGVLPEGFEIPGFGTPPILTPTPMDAADAGYGSNHNALVIGRLADGVSLDRAGARLAVVASRLAEAYPQWNDGIGARLEPARDAVVQQARRPLWVLFGAVGLVLLIACVSLAGIMLARAVTAEREIAVRVALGSSRGAIVRLLMSEAVVLSAAGGLAGLWVGSLGVDLLSRLGPSGIPRLAEVTVSLPVMAFTASCAVATALLIGLLPALRASRLSTRAIVNGSARAIGLISHTRVQRALVTAEVAIAVVLLTSAGLLLRSFVKLLQVDTGFETGGRVAMAVSLPQARYPNGARVTAFVDQVLERVNAIPGVRASGASVGLPLAFLVWRQQMTLEDRPAASLPEVPVVDLSISTPGYLSTLGIPLLRGRPLRESDEAETGFVALVNQAFVQANLPGEDPIGRRLRLAPPDALLPDVQSRDIPWYTIVGVVGDVRRFGLNVEARPEVYIPQRQDAGVAREFFVVAHTAIDDPGLPDAMRRAVWAVDADQPVDSVRTLDAMYASAVSQPRFVAQVIGAFGLAALLLAAIGVFGLVVNIVAARTREIGLRMALGARPGDVLRQVSLPAVLAAFAGIVIGSLIAVAATRLMATMLFGIEPLDPPTYATVALSVLGVAVVAAVLASVRAVRIDPVAALAAE